MKPWFAPAPRRLFTRPFTLLLPALGLVAAAAATAQPRDPMRAPSPAPTAGTAGTAARGAPGVNTPPPAPAIQPRHIVTAGDCRYVVERGRRHGLGDMLGGARIEAIDESAVTLREADNTLRRVPLYGAVQKREVAEATLAPAPQRSTASPSSPPASPPLARSAAARCTAVHPG